MLICLFLRVPAESLSWVEVTFCLPYTDFLNASSVISLGLLVCLHRQQLSLKASWEQSPGLPRSKRQGDEAESLAPTPVSLWSSFLSLGFFQRSPVSGPGEYFFPLPRISGLSSQSPLEEQFTNLREHQNPLEGGCVKTQIAGSIPRSCDSGGPGWRICISNEVPANADATGPGDQGLSSETPESIRLAFPHMSCGSLLQDIFYAKSFLTPGTLGRALAIQSWKSPL